MNYESRIITQSNYLLKKHKRVAEKSKHFEKFARYISQRSPPDYPFSYSETEGATQVFYGTTTLQIRTSKRQNNLSKVQLIKEFLIQQEGKDVSAEFIADFIFVYTILSVKKAEQEFKPIPPPPKPVEIDSAEAASKANLATQVAFSATRSAMEAVDQCEFSLKGLVDDAPDDWEVDWGN